MSNQQDANDKGAVPDAIRPKPEIPPTGLPLEQVRLTDAEARELGEGLVIRLQLEGKRVALDLAVAAIERRQVVYDMLAALLAVWLLFVLWGVRVLIPPGELQDWADRIATVGGTALSLAILSLSLWSWRGEWGAQADRKRELARTARHLIADFEDIQNEPTFDIMQLRRWKRGLVEFDNAMGERLARVPAKYLRAGHQHVGISYHMRRDIICQMCGRKWDVRFGQLRNSWRSWFFGCQGCGVQLESKQKGAT